MVEVLLKPYKFHFHMKLCSSMAMKAGSICSQYLHLCILSPQQEACSEKRKEHQLEKNILESKDVALLSSQLVIFHQS